MAGPGDCGLRQAQAALATEISPHTYINVMDQYRPCYRAGECPKIARPPTRQELTEARDCAARLGLRLAR